MQSNPWDEDPQKQPLAQPENSLSDDSTSPTGDASQSDNFSENSTGSTSSVSPPDGMSNNQAALERELANTESESTQGSVPESDTTTMLSHSPIQLPIQEPKQKQKRGMVIGIVVAVLAFLLAGGAGAYYIAMQGTSPQATQNSSATTVPEGWKSFTSKKFGISFIVPKEWQVNEFDPQALNTGARGVSGYTVSIYDPEVTTGSQTVTASKGSLDDFINEAKKGLASTQSEVKTKVMKWQGYDAVRISTELTDSQDEKVTLLMLYVQIGDYVFLIPDKDAVPREVLDGKVTQEVYSQFADSIRVDIKAVNAQSEDQAKEAPLTQGKDVNLGDVTVPAGWKKIQTKKYGISFVMPAGWATTEQYDGLNGAVLGLTVGDSQDFKNNIVIMVSEQSLDDFTNQAAYLYGAFGGGVSSKTEKMKWLGYEARRVTVSGAESSQTVTILFVRVGNYTYNIPDPDGKPLDNGFNINDYNTFVDSIRIAKS